MSASVTYACKRCGGTMTLENLDDRGGEVKCIHCGFRVLMKTKPPVVKRIRTM